ncbi:hypothetical protein [Microcella sp.]|uniref:hypothetical protein n=1 Tax=Microcella sp. TaxID=1913979 RepID=UPI00256DC6D8|nr:hypothetical protein [Microcella sp.]MBX9472997.1 hypothetical protein [Microcella sp.]
MRKHTFTDAEAQQLLSGETPAGRPELAGLAASIADVRRASLEVAPQPSVALASYLEQPALGVSAGAEPTRLKGIKKMVASIAGLGIAAKVAAASGVLVLGLAGVGAAGALPGPAQDAFDDVVSTIIVTDDEGTDDGLVDECTVDDGASEGTDGGALESTVDEGMEEGAEDGTDDGTVECVGDEPALPVGSKEFSAWVVQGAQDPDKVGAEFGAEVSEQARELREEKADERAENGTGNGGASNGFGNGGRGGETDDTDGTEDAPREGGKPEGVGGGRP